MSKPEKKTRIVDSQAVASNLKKTDTLSKNGKPFKINGVDCFWELKLPLREGSNDGDGILTLRNIQSKKALLINSDYYSLDNSYYTNSFNGVDFESFNKDCIKDVNFDGYKDFMIYGLEESGSAGSLYKVYLFNDKKKLFEQSKALSGYDILLDTVNKTRTSGGRNGYNYNVSVTDFFGRRGTIKYTETTEREVISDEPKRLLKTTYNKIVNKKVVQTIIDTTNFEGW
ncbi:MAG: hypothetical protein EOO43_15985 [Flavobacterium sp.]|nr:MAG: hypothetical protein EOO43_15985 [Flavobacterium sp.]